jgi:SAM-dependent methyltransferase
MQVKDYSYLYELEESFWWFAGMREITSVLLDPLCTPARKRMILDAGCGTGGNLSWLERNAGGGRVIGIDLSGNALRFCGKRKHERLVQATVTGLPFMDSTFDLLTSFDVLAQLPGEGMDECAISEMYRVLKPGGVSFVRVPAYEWIHSSHDRALGTQKRYRLGVLTEKMKRAGFHILRVTYANSLLLPIAALRRLALKPLGLADEGSDVKPLSPGLQWLNPMLLSVLKTEARLLRHPRRSLGMGLSAICIAEK